MAKKAQKPFELRAEEDDVLSREGTRRERPRVEHHELARGREDRVDHHQQEDGVQAVVADQRREPVGDRRP